MYQMERVLVLRAPLLQEHIARKRCRVAMIICCISILLHTIPTLNAYSVNQQNINCYVSDSELMSINNLFKYFYLMSLTIFCLFPVIALPILNIILICTIRQMNKFHIALGSSTAGANSNINKSNEKMAAITSIIISFYTTICLTPNLLWLPLQFGAFC